MQLIKIIILIIIIIAIALIVFTQYSHTSENNLNGGILTEKQIQKLINERTKLMRRRDNLIHELEANYAQKLRDLYDANPSASLEKSLRQYYQQNYLQELHEMNDRIKKIDDRLSFNAKQALSIAKYFNTAGYDDKHPGDLYNFEQVHPRYQKLREDFIYNPMSIKDDKDREDIIKGSFPSIERYHRYSEQDKMPVSANELPENVKTINEYKISYCDLPQEVIDDRNNGDVIYKDIELTSKSVPDDCETYNIDDIVTSIGDKCFDACIDLTEINIPNSVIKIGNSCFRYCTDLKEINIPKSVTELGNYCFMNCKNLTEINIPNSVIKIGKGCFMNCKNLTEINIPKSVIELGNSCFSDCSNLTEINIPNSITELSNECFCPCVGLTKINIPNSVTKLGDWCFGGCSNLTEINIPNSVKEIGHGCFRDCKNLISVHLSSSLITIGNSCFMNCSNLIEIAIPISVEKLGMYCFASCSNLIRIYLPKDLTIGIGCFAGCHNLTDRHII